MATEQHDVVILGGGNAGMGVTGPTRAAGLSVALIEPAELGGTCPNRGCTPKKVLVAAAHAMDEIARAKHHCIAVGESKLDWAALIDREKAMIKDLPARMERALEGRGVTLIRGHAKFAGPRTIVVDGRALEAKHIVIATGSKPRSLPIEGAEHLITSDDVLSERTLPREVIFIGGGVIAMEFSHVYARAGSKVTILEVQPRVLGEFDPDAVAEIVGESARIGIDVRTDVKIKRIAPLNGRLRVTFEQGGQEHALDADRVVNGAGRIADVDTLDLAAGQVDQERGRIKVDEHLRSVSNPAVHVCGDALWSSPQLSPIATYEGGIVGRNIVDGPRHKPGYLSIPSCVYTVPALASVGLTAAKAAEQGRRVKVHTNDLMNWLSTRTYAETAAWSRVVVEEESGHILGAQIVGHAGEELIHIFALAMKHGITATALRDTVFGFPTFSADIKSMLG
ncbi:dihydrolipoyl dehydrogenase family protein [Dongia deserti]|uniref:dihydrolipoyl dehydrogenase family protein n=1 Tax=Dongia deserti TaxID=2268030 RepID=UPI000E64AB8B|nr:NAD(P)/FAD-dependent oxidoreductase [Dongia deserti]